MRDIGLLTTADHPLLHHLLARFDNSPTLRVVLLLDAQPFGERHRSLFAERTRGAFDILPETRPKDREAHSFPSHNSEEFVSWLSSSPPLLLVNGGTPRIVAQGVLEAAFPGIVNVHPGILPKYRGASCCEWAILNGDPVGVTAHFMDTGIDSGPIILSRTLDIDPKWSYVDVRTALYRLWLATTVEAVVDVTTRGLTPASLPPQPQGDAPLPPLPDDLMASVIENVRSGAYARRVAASSEHIP